MKIDGKYNRLLTNTGLIFIGNLGRRAVSFLMVPFYTQWLSVEDYGTSDIVSVYATILTTVISLGIGEAIFVIPNQKTREEQISYFTSAFVYSIICSLIITLLYIVTVSYFGNIHNSFVEYILYICLMAFTGIISTYFQQFCKSINKITIFSIGGVVNAISMAVIAFMIIPQYKLQGFMWSIIASNFITAIFIFLCAGLYRYIKVQRFSYNRLKEMLSYSIPLVPNSIMWLLVAYLNRPLLDSYLGTYAIGLYALAIKFPNIISTIYDNFSNSWQISVLEQYGKDGFDKFFNRVLLLVTCILSILVVLISLSSNYFIRLLFNPSYFPCIKYIPILCLACVYLAIGSIVGSIFSAVRISKYYFYSSIWAAFSAIIFNYLLIGKFGLDGACWSYVISYFVGSISRIIYSRRFVQFKFIITHSVILLVTLLIVCSISYLDNYIIAVSLLLILILYFLRLSNFKFKMRFK
jgi:O-antigen/teichoic acid export membrane protein